jgi:hypothetical protein
MFLTGCKKHITVTFSSDDPYWHEENGIRFSINLYDLWPNDFYNNLRPQFSVEFQTDIEIDNISVRNYVVIVDKYDMYLEYNDVNKKINIKIYEPDNPPDNKEYFYLYKGYKYSGRTTLYSDYFSNETVKSNSKIKKYFREIELVKLSVNVAYTINGIEYFILLEKVFFIKKIEETYAIIDAFMSV